MVRLAGGLLFAAAVTAAGPVWPRSDARHAHAGQPPARVNHAPSTHHPHASPPVHAAPAPGIHPGGRPPVIHYPVRYPAVLRPAITTYMPPPVYAAPRVVTVPSPYYVVVGAGFTGTDLAYPAEPNWNWTPVDSVATLAGRGEMRFYCPDTRAYYPQVEDCPSPWLKVIP